MRAVRHPCNTKDSRQGSIEVSKDSWSVTLSLHQVIARSPRFIKRVSRVSAYGRAEYVPYLFCASVAAHFTPHYPCSIQ